MTVVKSKCYLCSSEDHLSRSGKVRDNEQLKILECQNCGLVYLSEQDHIDEHFYRESNMHKEEAQLPSPESWLKDCAADDARRLKFLENLLTNKNLLDFGCGAGGFLKLAQAYCRRAIGLEPETRLKDFFAAGKLEVYQEVKELDKLGDEFKFDIVTLFHVLEHLSDPRQVLIELGRLLQKNGQLIVEVPHAQDALLTLYKNVPFSHFTYWSCHLFLFTEYALRKLAWQAGFTVNYIKQIQRYPLSNHLYWLSHGLPGGHQQWHFLNSPELHAAYEKQLAAIGGCDTLIASFSKKE